MQRLRIFAVLAVLALPACAAAPPPAAKPVTVTAPPGSGTQYIRTPLVSSNGGTHRVNIGIAGVCCFPFVLDTGASDVSVSPAIFKAMVKGGHITREDYIDVVKYQTANGVSEGLRFRMPPMTIGDRTVYGVVGSVSPGSDMLLLGMSFLKKFKFYAIDPHNHVLVLGN